MADPIDCPACASVLTGGRVNPECKTCFGRGVVLPPPPVPVISEDMPIKKMQLERLLLLALQRFQIQTGARVTGVHVDYYDDPTPAGEGQHVLAKASIVLKK